MTFRSAGRRPLESFGNFSQYTPLETSDSLRLWLQQRSNLTYVTVSTSFPARQPRRLCLSESDKNTQPFWLPSCSVDYNVWSAKGPESPIGTAIRSTRLRIIKSGLQSSNVGLYSAWRRAQDRTAWRRFSELSELLFPSTFQSTQEVSILTDGGDVRSLPEYT